MENEKIVGDEANENTAAPQEDSNDKVLRLAAEMENLRKRLTKEREEAVRFALQTFAKDILRVADHLRLALQNGTKIPETLQSFITGIEMTEKELHTIFEKHGIKKVSSLGEVFNAHYHQAISEDSAATGEVNTITQVLQEGYMLHERLLRPALVVVKK